ncbi:MAG: hypothetical protein O2887_08970 [Bacteroidetes bacterium]|nr:hypothetical protein [Bacteroidota bacterium]MDA1120605.1 hypothetical protein [Bacteroidota bacterium]
MRGIPFGLSVVCVVLLFLSCDTSSKNQFAITTSDSLVFKQAYANGILVNEGFERCRRFVDDWLEHADPTTGLIPRNLYEDTDIWNAKDAAADNYPFMVLTAALTDQKLFQGRMLEMLASETRLTSRIDNLPDTYSFAKQDFISPDPNLDDILFGSSEYIKDGLLPLTEWLGKSPWSERMITILDDIWKHAPIQTPFGKIVSTNVELNGEMLQVLSRIYWMTGDQKYLDWAIHLGDYYLLDDQHPTRNFSVLRLRDHGCEVVSGLCELYATLSVADPEKKIIYQPQIHEMLNRILEVGRNEDGLFYNSINPQTGKILQNETADNFGYTLNGFYTVYQVDSVEAYRNATLKGLSALNGKYRNFDWEHGSSDGYADAIEGALNLYAREPIESTAAWIDSEIQVMWSMQDSSHRANTSQWRSSGVIEGWHGDGNFARTTIMYCLWKTQGMTVVPWRNDIQIGAVIRGNDMMISTAVDTEWQGVLKFDAPRHKTNMNMPYDWPRINQFPQWFTTEENSTYQLVNLQGSKKESFTGKQLTDGVNVKLIKGVNQFVLRNL